MLVLGLCVMMKLVEYSSGRLLLLQDHPNQDDSSSSSSTSNEGSDSASSAGSTSPGSPRKCSWSISKATRKKRKCASKYFGPACGVEARRVPVAMSGAASLCPGGDAAATVKARLDPDLLNSNPGSGLLHVGTAACTTLPGLPDSFVSNASSQDFDNSDYQWFLDYGYREAGVVQPCSDPATTTLDTVTTPVTLRGSSQPASVFSSMSLSLGGPHDFSYDDLAKNLDANLAEIDMENFRTEDIHSILALPAMCCGDLQTTNGHGEMIASVTGSLIGKIDTSSTQEESAGSGTDMSICKSELLFSPVKEVAPPLGANISVDSLDCELESDILLTCQANKDNYTIAFEGSVALCSEGGDSTDFPDTTGESETATSESNNWSGRFNLEASTALVRSDLVYTTWSKVSEMHHHRPESGNNNTRQLRNLQLTSLHDPSTACKSQSLPNLHKRHLGRLRHRPHHQPMIPRTAQLCCSVESDHCVKLFDVQTSSSAHSHASDSGKQSFNLVKLFMKQKSISNDKMSIGGASYDGRVSNESSDWQSESESCGMEAQPPNNKLDNRQQQQGEFQETPVRRPQFLGSHLISGTELASSELECSTRFFPVAEQNNARNQQQQQQQRNVDVINNVFGGSKPSNINNNNNNNNDVLRRCHGTQTKRLNGSESARLACSIDAAQPTERRTTDVEITSSPAPRRKAHVIATMKNVSTQIPVHVIDQGIQTSCFADVNAKTSFQLLESPNKTSVVKTITPNIRPKPRSYSATTTPEDTSKPVYVYYPNYTLPDLAFLKEKQENFDANVFLIPQKYKLPSQPRRACNRSKLRPFSCNDVETLKKKGLSHIQDWDSLNVLLPQEFKKLLEDAPDGERVPNMEYPTTTTANSSVSSTATPSSGYRGSSTNVSDSSIHRTNVSPLYVYRYDSAGSESSSVFKSSAPPLPKRSISLSDDKCPPPRPPLPRGILRKERQKERHSTPDIGRLTHELVSKRLSLHEPYERDEGVELESSGGGDGGGARPPTPPLQQRKDILNNNTGPLWDEREMLRLRSQVSHFLLNQQNPEQATETDQTGSLDHSGDSAIKKSVSFAQKVEVVAKERLVQPPNSPNAHPLSRLYQQQQGPHMSAGEATAETSVPVEEILSVAPEVGSAARYASGRSQASRPQRPVLVDLNQKRELVLAVKDAVEQLLAHYSQPHQAQGEAGAHHLALQCLCPALLGLLGDSLRPQVDTVFGPVNNSTWRVVEASAQQGQVSKALNDLVMRLNGDDLLTEGLMKFNAFIFGLLNVHSLDAWLNFLRTRESVLQKHYDPGSFMFLANSATRNLYDQLITIVEPLSLLPFKLDLLYERKVLEYSLQRLSGGQEAPLSPNGLREWTRKLVRSIQSSLTAEGGDDSSISSSMRKALAEETANYCLQNELLLQQAAEHVSRDHAVKQRPRSCIDAQQNSFSLTDIASTMKKRWSGIQLGSKLFQAFDKLTTEETDSEYTDSLDRPRRKSRQPAAAQNSSSNTSDDNNETMPRDDTPPPPLPPCFVPQLPVDEGGKTPTGEDKFRRLQMKWELLSGKEGKPPPTRSRIPRLVSSPVRPSVPLPGSAPVSRIPTNKKPAAATNKTTANSRPMVKARSLSRESAAEEGRVAPRQPSLPGRKPPTTPQRVQPGLRQPLRNVAGKSVGAKPSAAVKPKPRVSLDSQCYIRTLCHRLATDSGHLSYNEGEQLAVVLEVDARWLLCCRADQKGLVPRDDVIFLETR